jgi:predicted ATPase
MGSTVVGREAELRTIERLIEDDAPGATALVLDGEAGIGKTTVWLAGVERARERGYRVLSCRPAETEVSLPYVSLGDLLEPVGEEVAGHAALAAALGRGGQTAPGRLEVSRASLAVLRTLAGRAPLLVAVDDVQWVDAASAAVLGFVLRRVADAPLRILVARRSERDAAAPLGLARAVEGLTMLRIGPLEPGDLDRLLRSTLDLQLPRPRLLELHRVSAGNPFYALEI